MTTQEAALVSPEEFLKLDSELKQIMVDQASGKFDRKPTETDEQWKKRLSDTMRRGVELTSILRRTNTGPGKPKRSAKNKNVDMEGLAKSLLG